MTAIRKRTWTTPSGEPKTAWLVDYKDQAGKRRAKQFARKKDAEAWRVGAEHEVAVGTHTADRDSITVAVAAELWVEKAEREGRERSTTDAYRSIIKLHIVPFLGGRRLSSLTRPMIEQYRDDLLIQRSRAMAGKAVRSLSMLMTEAQRRGFVAQNVAKDVRVVRPSRDRARVVIPSRAELRALLEAAGPNERAIIMTVIATGIRASELRGLPWRDVDLKRARLTVSQRSDAWSVIGSPKSAAGTRSIPMPPELVVALLEWKLRAAPNDLGLVFPSKVGTPYSHSNLLRRLYGPLQVRAGVADPVLDMHGALKLDEKGQPLMKARYGFHALRHAAASAWIEARVDLKRLQVWLGHESVQMTIDLYGHLMIDEDKDDEFALASSRELFK